jgi:hypothetical protein
MATQGATLQRQGHLPVWPILAVVVFAIAGAIGLRILDEVQAPAPTTTAVDRTSTAKGVERFVPAEPVTIPFSAIEASSAAIRERAAVPFHSSGRAHEVNLGVDASGTAFAGILADPDAWVSQTPANAPRASAITFANGLENPGGYVTAPLAQATGGSGYGDCVVGHCRQQR